MSIFPFSLIRMPILFKNKWWDKNNLCSYTDRATPSHGWCLPWSFPHFNFVCNIRFRLEVCSFLSYSALDFGSRRISQAFRALQNSPCLPKTPVSQSLLETYTDVHYVGHCFLAAITMVLAMTGYIKTVMSEDCRISMAWVWMRWRLCIGWSVLCSRLDKWRRQHKGDFSLGGVFFFWHQVSIFGEKH
jgi:hypothetical protein